MQRRVAVVSLAIAAAILSGCLPETRMLWSPDGKYALVRGGDGLYLSDGDGKLSPRIAEDVQAVAWMPDSRQFIAACGKTLATWDELLPHLSEVRQKAARSEAEAFRGEVLAYKGDWKDFYFKTPSADIRAALICLRDQYGKELAPVVGEAWSGLKERCYEIAIMRLFDVSDGQARENKVLLESLEPVAEIRVSPTGKAFAYAAPPYPALGAEAAFSLFVASFEFPDKTMHVADRVSIFFDWTPTGRSLIYAFSQDTDAQALDRRADLFGEDLVYRRDHMPESQSHLRIGLIIRLTVLTETDAVRPADRWDCLANVPFSDSMPVHCLQGGRVLFAAEEVHLPCPPGGLPVGLTLFSAPLNGKREIAKVLTPEVQKRIHDMEGRLDLMQVSPDETRLCIPGKQGTVIVVDLLTGNLTEACAGDAVWQATIPVWRSKDELCFVVKKDSKLGTAKRSEMVLWSSSGTRCISKDWPESIAKGFLDR